MEALALTKFVFHLPGALFGLLEAADRVRVLTIAEVDVAQVNFGAVEILQQLALPLHEKNEYISVNKAVTKKINMIISQPFSRLEM